MKIVNIKNRTYFYYLIINLLHPLSMLTKTFLILTCIVASLSAEWLHRPEGAKKLCFTWDPADTTNMM